MTTSTLTTSVISGRIVAAIAVAGLVTSGVLGFLYSFDDPAAQWPQAPPAQDALTQSLDLNRIDDFRYVNDTQVEVTDDLGHQFAMKFTAACPEFKTAKDFSLVTESYRNMDRFTAVSVAGHICTFKDFALEH
jgi:hypothetical protein